VPIKLWDVLDTTLCDKVCHWLPTFRWVSPVSSINKTDRHDITEILLKVALNTIAMNPSKSSNQNAISVVNVVLIGSTSATIVLESFMTIRRGNEPQYQCLNFICKWSPSLLTKILVDFVYLAYYLWFSSSNKRLNYLAFQFFDSLAWQKLIQWT
jgi:hypothetical protein